MKKCALIVFVSSIVLFHGTVLAADLKITCSNGEKDCELKGDSLFSQGQGEEWYPGNVVSKILSYENSSSEKRNALLIPKRSDKKNALEGELLIRIATETNSSLWAGTLDTFYEQHKISLGTIDAQTEQEYTITVSMDQSAENEYQQTSTAFTLDLGFENTKGKEEVCKEAVPNAPHNLSVTTGTNEVTLSWQTVSSPVTAYMLSYSPDFDNRSAQIAVVGNATTKQYQLTNLSGGTTYYFKIQAINGCATGPFSSVIAARPNGTAAKPVSEVLGTHAKAKNITTPPPPPLSVLSFSSRYFFGGAAILGLGFIILLLRRIIRYGYKRTSIS
ncbi:fibronectin type III domain-containing protein [Candidatus Roizmanbacteria bacterium]|nr:fibronectin type III domain-containing protein [Candidatus Roizmanbacteria bacterium]